MKKYFESKGGELSRADWFKWWDNPERADQLLDAMLIFGIKDFIEVLPSSNEDMHKR